MLGTALLGGSLFLVAWSLGSQIYRVPTFQAARVQGFHPFKVFFRLARTVSTSRVKKFQFSSIFSMRKKVPAVEELGNFLPVSFAGNFLRWFWELRGRCPPTASSAHSPSSRGWSMGPCAWRVSRMRTWASNRPHSGTTSCTWDDFRRKTWGFQTSNRKHMGDVLN